MNTQVIFFHSVTIVFQCTCSIWKFQIRDGIWAISATYTTAVATPDSYPTASQQELPLTDFWINCHTTCPSPLQKGLFSVCVPIRITGSDHRHCLSPHAPACHPWGEVTGFIFNRASDFVSWERSFLISLSSHWREQKGQSFGLHSPGPGLTASRFRSSVRRTKPSWNRPHGCPSPRTEQGASHHLQAPTSWRRSWRYSQATICTHESLSTGLEEVQWTLYGVDLRWCSFRQARCQAVSQSRFYYKFHKEPFAEY